MRRALAVVVGISTIIASAGLAGTAAAGVTTPAAVPAVFTHPGVLVSRSQLDFVKAKVAAGAQPWKGAYDQMVAHPLAAQSRNPSPRAVVECGYISNPNLGCTEERQDALAAYANALRWYITGDSRYAQKAISIMDAWSAVIRSHTAPIPMSAPRKRPNARKNPATSSASGPIGPREHGPDVRPPTKETVWRSSRAGCEDSKRSGRRRGIPSAPSASTGRTTAQAKSRCLSLALRPSGWCHTMPS
jgi:Alginate lyase